MMIPDPTLPFEVQEPVTLLAMCLWGEARGCTRAGKLGVAFVILNRARLAPRYGVGLTGVILRPYQFSSFNKNDPNRIKLLKPLEHDSAQAWQDCYSVAFAVNAGDEVLDLTNGAVFYYSFPLRQPPAAWGKVIQTATIDALHFFKAA